MRDVIIIISGGDKGMNKLTVIGAGAMAEALISGMIENQLLESKNIWVTNRSNKEKLQGLAETYGVTPSYQLEELFSRYQCYFTSNEA